MSMSIEGKITLADGSVSGFQIVMVTTARAGRSEHVTFAVSRL